MPKVFQRNRGFTLIELLVVISIISLLSTIILTNIKTAKDKAKDAARILYIRQLINATEAYYSDNSAPPNIYTNFPDETTTLDNLGWNILMNKLGMPLTNCTSSECLYTYDMTPANYESSLSLVDYCIYMPPGSFIYSTFVYSRSQTGNDNLLPPSLGFPYNLYYIKGGGSSQPFAYLRGTRPDLPACGTYRAK